MVEFYKESDLEWIKPLFEENESILGTYSYFSWQWLKNRKPSEFIMVIRPHAFAHVHIRKDGVKVINSIAVDPSQKGKGLGKKLIEEIGRPLFLKTDHDNEESNAFYKKLGFELIGQKKSKSGNKTFNLYRK